MQPSLRSRFSLLPSITHLHKPDLCSSLWSLQLATELGTMLRCNVERGKDFSAMTLMTEKLRTLSAGFQSKSAQLIQVHK